MRKHLLEPLSESLCQLFWLLQIGRIRFPQQCHKVAWGSKYSQYIVIYCHLVSWLHHLAHLLCHFLIFCVLSCNFIATFCTHTVPRIHLNKGIRHIKILHHHIHFLQNCSIFFLLFMIDTAPNFLGAQNSDRELKRREFQICNFRHE